MADNPAAQELIPLEQEVLDEYDKLSTNMKTVRIQANWAKRTKSLTGVAGYITR